MTVLKISNVRKIFCTYDSYVDLYVSVIFVPRCLSQGVRYRLAQVVGSLIAWEGIITQEVTPTD